MHIDSAMKEARFICVGEIDQWAATIRRLGNVKYVGWIGDLREIYADTKILLVPSIWPEPFGRLAVEAMASGIPIIASRTDGLPEVVGDAGILVDNFERVDIWIREFNRLLDDDDLYEELSTKSIVRASKFSADIQYRRFLALLNRLGLVSGENVE